MFVVLARSGFEFESFRVHLKTVPVQKPDKEEVVDVEGDSQDVETRGSRQPVARERPAVVHLAETILWLKTILKSRS